MSAMGDMPSMDHVLRDAVRLKKVVSVELAVDVLDMIADCVMAGMARSGSVYELKLEPEVLWRAFENTVDLLKSQVEVVGDENVTVSDLETIDA